MKKLTAGLIGLLMTFGLMACSGGGTPGAETGNAGGGVDIGYSVPDTTNPFVGWLTGEVKTLAEADGLTVQIADAGNNSAKQIEQLENFIAMKVKAIALMPVDPTAVPDVIKKAQAAGIKVLVAGTDTGVYDVMMNTDQHAMGVEIATMGKEWLLDTFSSDGTEAGLTTKPKVLVLKYTATIDGTNRSQGILDTITEWGHADVVVAQAEAITAADARSVLENMWQQNSDASLVMTYNADSAVGANEYLMGQVGIDKAEMAIFSGDSSDPVKELIAKSATNESLFRGTMGIVGPKIDGELVDLPVATFNALKGLTQGELVYGSRITDAVARVTPETIAAEQ